MRFVLLLSSALLIAGCKNPDDQLPGITSITVNGQDESHFLVSAGQNMLVDIETNDNKALKQVMLKLQAISGLHNHSSNSDIPFLRQLSFGTLDTTLLQNINGQESNMQFVLPLPNTISGGWNMTVGVLDENGNYFSDTYILHVHNDSTPFAVVNSVHPAAATTGVVTIEHPDSLINFRLQGNMVDHTGFDSIVVRLASSSSTLWRKTWHFADGTWSFDLNNIIINDTLNSGTYTFETNAVDMQGWTSIYRGTIKIN